MSTEPTNLDIIDKEVFIDSAKSYLYQLDYSELIVLKAHYIGIYDADLSTFKDCIWLMLIRKELNKREKWSGKKAK